MHLHVHTEYSLIDGLIRVGDLVDAVTADNQIAVAATDHGNLGGWFALHQATSGRDGGPFPIYGMEAYLAVGSRFERDQVTFTTNTDDDTGTTNTEDKANYHLTLLAATPTGYTNLIRLSNAAQEQFWHKPRIDLDLLTTHSEGLIVLTGCLGGPVLSHLAHGDPDTAAHNLQALISAVGADNVYVELMEHGVPGETDAQADLVRLAQTHGVRWVVTNDCHYVHDTDHDGHEAWLCVGKKHSDGSPVTLADTDRWRFPGGGYHVRTSAQMRALRNEPWWAEGCDETVRIAERIGEDVMPNYPMRLPQFPLPDGYTTASAYLRDLVRDGALHRYGEDPDRPGKLPPHVNERLQYEFGVIDQAGMCDYFLIAWEMVSWARNQGILVGPGRGSGASSALAYSLGITQVEPLSNHLLFERFLNPERAGMPDFDIDFDEARRQEVINHLVDRYGADSVARIGTRGVVRSRAAVKDAGRVLGLSPAVTAKLAETIPYEDGGKPRTLTKMLDPTMRDDPSTKPFLDVLATVDGGDDLVRLAQQFEGVARSESIHACGVVISSEPLASLLPLRRDRAGEKQSGLQASWVTEWEGAEIEAAGFLKMDVLAIRNLTVMARAVQLIQETTGETVDVVSIDPDHPTDMVRDGRAWDLIARGRTEGVFQLESPQMTALAMDVKPRSLSEVSALVALYRPGPMAAGMHTRYAARRNGREEVTYDYLTTDPAERAVVTSVLDETYGSIVFQEQLMRLGGEVAGLSVGMKNKLQKAFSKKKADLMAEVHDAFIAGGVAGDGPAGVRFARATLDVLWATFEGSASYLFNASHSAAYGQLAYQTAYLKANWPTQYGAALLATTDRDDKRAAILRSLTSENITIHPPDVNASMETTTVEAGGDGVRLGLAEIKGVGKVAAHVVAERLDAGPFLSLSDLLRRVTVPDTKGKLAPLGVAVVEVLIEAGAVDQFGPRKGLMRVVRAAKEDPRVCSRAEWGTFERSQRQRARTGVTLGVHPLEVNRTKVAEAIVGAGFTPDRLVSVVKIGDVVDGSVVSVPGIVVGWTEKPYSKGRMASVLLEGSTGVQVEVVVWDDDLARLRRNGLVPPLGVPVVVDAKVSSRMFTREVVDESGDTVVEQSVRTSLTVRNITVLRVDDGGVEDQWDDSVVWVPERRSDPSASVMVRVLAGRTPPASSPTHLVPLDALVDSGPRAWTRPNTAPHHSVVYAVAHAGAALDEVRVAVDGDVAEATLDGWTPIRPTHSPTR